MIHLLQNKSRLAPGHPRRRSRHVEEGALVQRRHELPAEQEKDRNGREEQRERAADHDLSSSYGPADYRRVSGYERARDRMLSLGSDLASNEPRRKGWGEGNGKERRERHRVRLGERQGLE